MPPDRGRASKACASCRKQKTRCYESGRSGAPCLRCERLKQRCSLAKEAPEEEVSPSEAGTAARLERLETVVSRLVERLGEDPVQTLDQTGWHNDGNLVEMASTEDSIPEGDAAAPVLVIRDLAADTGIEMPKGSQDLSLHDLVPAELARSLISIFLEHYGRWVLFDPDEDTEIFLSRLEKTPLLFSACCLIAVRHTSQDTAARLAPELYDRAHSLVQTALLLSPQPIEFFQAVLILCMWSTTVGQVPLSIDSWLLSGFALQHCQSSVLFAAVTSSPLPASDVKGDTLKCWFLWNHLCLVHLHYCVGTSRRSMLQDWHIARCRAIVGSNRVTSYELRMVAEIHLYRAVYGLLSKPMDIAESLATLQSWKKEWRFVLEQPRAQFLMMGWHFAHLLLHDRYSECKSTHAQESIVIGMTTHSSTIIRLAMDTVDERTRHLSDHIYHMITYAAITICRLHDQAIDYDTEELDSLISQLVEWLRSIGLRCHVSHTFGKIIAQFHRKMCLGTEEATDVPQHEDMLSEEFIRTYFPDFLGLGATTSGGLDLECAQDDIPPDA